MLPTRVCCCIPFEIGIQVRLRRNCNDLHTSITTYCVQVLLVSLTVLRVTGIVFSVFYGPFIYLVICLASIFIAADFILLYSLFWKTNEKKPACEFSNQKVWIWIWLVLNLLAVLGLAVALGKAVLQVSVMIPHSFLGIIFYVKACI